MITVPNTARTPSTVTLSVVIPAHDEESTIGACLDALLPGLDDDAEVIVVPNGCSDHTADAARAYPVQVVELETRSKIAALNAGDAAASHHPRIYLDADIRVDGATVRALAEALSTDRPLSASPRVRFDTSRSTWPVRAFYRVYAETPYVRDRLVGLGIYGLSAAGRDRFLRFPDLLCDDLYVQRLFEAHERATTPGEFTVAAPRDLANLMKVRTRVARGNQGLEAAQGTQRFGRTTAGTSRSLLGLVRRRPALAPAAAMYVAITIASRLRARGARPGEWHRDVSTREATR